MARLNQCRRLWFSRITSCDQVNFGSSIPVNGSRTVTRTNRGDCVKAVIKVKVRNSDLVKNRPGIESIASESKHVNNKNCINQPADHQPTEGCDIKLMCQK